MDKPANYVTRTIRGADEELCLLVSDYGAVIRVKCGRPTTTTPLLHLCARLRRKPNARPHSITSGNKWEWAAVSVQQLTRSRQQETRQWKRAFHALSPKRLEITLKCTKTRILHERKRRRLESDIIASSNLAACRKASLKSVAGRQCNHACSKGKTEGEIKGKC